MSAALVVYYAVYFSMLVIIGLFTGRITFSGAIPTNTLVIVLGVVVVVLSIAMMIPAVAPLGDLKSSLCRWPRRISTSCWTCFPSPDSSQSAA